jgi:DNA polymerase delta subunit 3
MKYIIPVFHFLILFFLFQRGIKRKSSVRLESRARTPENPAVTNKVKVKGRVVLSDDESDTVPQPPPRRKSKVALRTESPEREIDQAAMALMDIDDGLCC